MWDRKRMFLVTMLSAFLPVLSACGSPPQVPAYEIPSLSELDESQYRAIREDVEAVLPPLSDEQAMDAAKSLRGVLDRLASSPGLQSCIPAPKRASAKESVGSALASDWTNIETSEEFVDKVVSREVIGAIGALLSATENCDTARIGALLKTENDYFDFDDIDLSEPSDDSLSKYQKCMEEMDKELTENQCSPVAQDSPSAPASDQGDAGEPLPGGVPEPEGTARAPKAASTPTLAPSPVKDAIQKTVIAAIGTAVTVAVGGLLGAESAARVLRGVPPIPLPLIAGAAGGAGTAAGIAAGELAGLAYDTLRGGGPAEEHAGTSPASGGVKMCGVMDGRLPAGHPLMGASFKIEGIPLGPKEFISACTCFFDRDQPIVDFYCKDDFERRKDCALNPFGPDDGPRPECINLLKKDNDIPDNPNPQCFVDCPEPYMLTSSDACTCGKSIPAFDPGSLRTCIAIDCVDSEPVVDFVTGQCGCLSGIDNGGNGGIFDPKFPMEPPVFSTINAGIDEPVEVLSDPGQPSSFVDMVPAGYSGIRIIGETKIVESAVWAPIEFRDAVGKVVSGWVDSKYLEGEWISDGLRSQ